MADNPGRRAPVDFPDRSGLSAGTPGQNDLAKGLRGGLQGTDMAAPPSYLSPGNQNKESLGSPRN